LDYAADGEDGAEEGIGSQIGVVAIDCVLYWTIDAD